MGLQYELHSEVQLRVAYAWTGPGAGVTVGGILDVQGYGSAMLVAGIWDHPVACSAIAAVLESDDPGMSGATLVPNERVLSNGYPTFTTVGGEYALRTGVLTEKRYLQCQITRVGPRAMWMYGIWVLADPDVIPQADGIVSP